MSDVYGLGSGGGDALDGFFADAARGVKRAANKGVRAAGRGVKAAGRGVKAAGRAAGRGVKAAGRAAGKAGKGLASYAAPVLAAAGAVAAGAACGSLGVPPHLCAKGGAALGQAVGGALSRKLGVPVKSLPVDPMALIKGDPKALIVLGRTIAAEAGMPLPSPEAAMALAAKKAGLPQQVLDVGLMAQKLKAGAKPSARASVSYLGSMGGLDASQRVRLSGDDDW